MAIKGWGKAVWGGALVGLLLAGWLSGPASAQSGPYSAQIQRALRAIGLSGAAGVWTVPLKAPDGSAAAPSYSFASQPTYGLYLTGTTMVLSTAGGNSRIAFPNNGTNALVVGSGSSYGFSSNADPSSAGSDTTLARGGAAGKLTLTGTTPMLQLGGTTSSFSAIKDGGSNGVLIRKADDSAYAPVFADSVIITGTAGLKINSGTVLVSGVAPSALSACGAGTAPTFVWTNGTAAFEILTGSATPVATCTWTMPAAAHAWVCDITDITTQTANVFVQRMSASSTTSVTMTNYNTAGAATAVVASDHLLVSCLGG